MTTRLALSALLAAFLALPAPALAALSRHVPGEVLVKFKDGTAPVRRAGALAAHAHLALAELDGGFTHVKVRPGETVEEALATYAEDPAVEWVQPNYVYRASAVPNDPSYLQQWALSNSGQTVSASFLQSGDGLYDTANPGTFGADIDVERAWDVENDCSPVVVAVVDSGVNYDHQDLSANMWNDPNGVYTLHGADFIDNDGDPMDSNGHGTHVAGIIGARGNNSAGTAGVCWSAKIMAVRVLDTTGSGSTAGILSGVAFARDHGAKIINMSLGGSGYDPAYASVVDSAVAAGVLVVVAAGNDGVNNDTTPTYPCNFSNPGLLCVAALDQRFGLASFSNYGVSNVDVAAPGTNILATWPGTQTVIDEPLTTGWTFVAGFGYATLQDNTGAPVANIIADPASGGRYGANFDAHAYKSFDTSGADVASVEFWALVDVPSTDYVRMVCRSVGGDPFGTGVVELERDSLHSGGFFPTGLDISVCKGTSSTIGFELYSAPGSVGGQGLAIALMDVKKLTRNTTSYNVLAGTSMATPVVAGVAALVRSYQPAFTPADVVGAIAGGGLTLPSLTGKTRTGKAVRAFGALNYVNPPRNVTYSVR